MSKNMFNKYQALPIPRLRDWDSNGLAKKKFSTLKIPRQKSANIHKNDQSVATSQQT